MSLGSSGIPHKVLKIRIPSWMINQVRSGGSECGGFRVQAPGCKVSYYDSELNVSKFAFDRSSDTLGGSILLEQVYRRLLAQRTRSGRRPRSDAASKVRDKGEQPFQGLYFGRSRTHASMHALRW